MPTYQVVITGLRPDQKAEEALTRLAATFAQPPERLARLLQAPRTVVKRGTDGVNAARLQSAIEAAGFQCAVEVEYAPAHPAPAGRETAPAPAPTQPLPAVEPAAVSLPPNAPEPDVMPAEAATDYVPSSTVALIRATYTAAPIALTAAVALGVLTKDLAQIPVWLTLASLVMGLVAYGAFVAYGGVHPPKIPRTGKRHGIWVALIWLLCFGAPLLYTWMSTPGETHQAPLRLAVWPAITLAGVVLIASTKGFWKSAKTLRAALSGNGWFIAIFLFLLPYALPYGLLLLVPRTTLLEMNFLLLGGIYVVATGASLYATGLAWEVLFGGRSESFTVRSFRRPTILTTETKYWVEHHRAIARTFTPLDDLLEFHQDTFIWLVLLLLFAGVCGLVYWIWFR